MQHPTNSHSEEWRPVVGYEGVYEVSDHGRVRSLDRIVHSLGTLRSVPNNTGGARGGLQRRRGRILKPQRNGRGYYKVQLGRGRVRTVHSLVAEAFLGPRPEGLDVNHIDNNGYNNCASNLEYVTRRENLSHMTLQGRRVKQKLNENVVRAIHRERAAGVPFKELANRYGCSYDAVRDAYRGKTWAWLKPNAPEA